MVPLLGLSLLSEGACNLLKCSMGSCSSRLLLERNVADEFDKDGAVVCMPDNPNVWSDGGLVGASSAGSGMFAHLHGDAWGHREWRHLDVVQAARGAGVDSSGALCSVPRSLQTVQRAELTGLPLLFKHWMRYML